MGTGLLLAYISTHDLSKITFFHLFIFYTITTLGLSIGLTSSTILAAISGYLFGWSATTYVFISYSIAISIGYIIGYKLGSPLVDTVKQKNATINKYLKELVNSPLKTVFFIRISPVLPFGTMNYLLSGLKVPFIQYLIGSILGMIPRVLLTIFLGIKAGSLVESYKIGYQPGWVKIVLAIFFIVSIMYLLLKIKQAKK